MGNDTYFVHVDDAVEVQAELQNMRLRVDNQDPIDATVGDELPIHPYHVMAWKYDYDIGRGLKFVVYSMEAMMHHMLIVPMVGALAHYTYIPTGKEQQDKHGGGINMSGSNQEGNVEDNSLILDFYVCFLCVLYYGYFYLVFWD
ncbi:unnamed protein product [Lactuca saligna]|uniref:Uncharacterized protein n=1 Tax=Lactuca saligna TaxID=75948 RepID=A0AA35YT10_LACSI|nr:unnamed protein product [Lactuca saligna]